MPNILRSAVAMQLPAWTLQQAISHDTEAAPASKQGMQVMPMMGIPLSFNFALTNGQRALDLPLDGMCQAGAMQHLHDQSLACGI